MVVASVTLCKAEIPERFICVCANPSAVLVKLTSVPISLKFVPSVLYSQMYALGAVEVRRSVASKVDNDTLKPVFALTVN